MGTGGVELLAYRLHLSIPRAQGKVHAHALWARGGDYMMEEQQISVSASSSSSTPPPPPTPIADDTSRRAGMGQADRCTFCYKSAYIRQSRMPAASLSQMMKSRHNGGLLAAILPSRGLCLPCISTKTYDVDILYTCIWLDPSKCVFGICMYYQLVYLRY